MKRLPIRWIVLSMVSIMLIPALYSCSPQSVRPTPQAQIYENIFFENITAGPNTEVVYIPEIMKTEAMAIAVLESKNAFRRVERLVQGAPYEEKTLIVRTCVTDMRLVSSSARESASKWGGIIGGAIAGASYMDVEVSLVDAATGDTVSKKTISSANNPVAAHFSGGYSDRSLPADMGVIVAEYIFETLPRKAP